MSKAISPHKLDRIYTLPNITDISYCCIIFHHNLNMFNALLSLKQLGSPSLAPKNPRVLVFNACPCLVHVPPVSDFYQTTLEPIRLASVHIVVSIGTFFKLFMAVITLFSHQVRSFLVRFESVIITSKLSLYC